ncbi:hypothetical protein K3495_g3729 [Podosphaera aphanis]|nr:hypothetical protein K3495_g3729 [Podosphaera aphanis]
MATIYEGSTPPPPTIHTPRTPRHGFLDDYEPYSPSKSTPLSRAARCSPGVERKNIPPNSSSYYLRSHCTPPPMSSNKVAATHKAAPKTPQTGPKRHFARDLFSDMAASGNKEPYTAKQDSGNKLCLSPAFLESSEVTESSAESNSIRTNGMLPTPAKTPAKRPRKASSSITSVARNLFATQSITSLKMDCNFHTVPSSESSVGKDFDATTMFSDQNNRGPTIDRSESNPFYVKPNSSATRSNKWPNKRTKIMVPGEGMQTLEEIQQRDDGIIYVFRGKKRFRKFAEIDREALDCDDETSKESQIEDSLNDEICKDLHNDSSLRVDLCRPLSRSSLKPRLLFPPIQFPKIQGPKSPVLYDTDDEEVETDIEEPNLCTPKRISYDKNTTPKASRVAPISPMSTTRITRSKKSEIDNISLSPFSTPRVTRSNKFDYDDLSKSPLSTTRVTRSKKFMLEDSSTPPLESKYAESEEHVRYSSRRGAKPHLFNSWQRIKPTSENQSKKRIGEPISRAGGAKRAKT